jgi:hypothetical protein
MFFAIFQRKGEVQLLRSSLTGRSRLYILFPNAHPIDDNYGCYPGRFDYRSSHRWEEFRDKNNFSVESSGAVSFFDHFTSTQIA